MRFTPSCAPRMAHLRVGDPLDKSTDIGAIVAPVQLDAIERLVAAGAAEGLEIWRADDAIPRRGCFYPPTLVTGVEPAFAARARRDFRPGAGRR